MEDFRHAFRPTAEAASRTIDPERAIERPRLGAIRAPCFVRRGGHFANALARVKDSDFRGRRISMLALLCLLTRMGFSCARPPSTALSFRQVGSSRLRARAREASSATAGSWWAGVGRRVDFGHFWACFPADRGSCLEKSERATGHRETEAWCHQSTLLRAAGRSLRKLLFAR